MHSLLERISKIPRDVGKTAGSLLEERQTMAPVPPYPSREGAHMQCSRLAENPATRRKRHATKTSLQFEKLLSYKLAYLRHVR